MCGQTMNYHTRAIARHVLYLTLIVRVSGCPVRLLIKLGVLLLAVETFQMWWYFMEEIGALLLF